MTFATCPTCQELWQKKEDAREHWLIDHAGNHESQAYRDLRMHEKAWREHWLTHETHRCDYSITLPTCSLCGKRRPA